MHQIIKDDMVSFKARQRSFHKQWNVDVDAVLAGLRVLDILW